MREKKVRGNLVRKTFGRKADSANWKREMMSELELEWQLWRRKVGELHVKRKGRGGKVALS